MPQLAEEARNAQRYAAAATDALLVRVALSSRFACSCWSESAGGRGRLRCEPRDRLPLVAALPGGWLVGAGRPAAGAEAAAEAAFARGAAADLCGTQPLEGGAGDRIQPRRLASLQGLVRAQPLLPVQ